jgi:shikimate dehydrogenase
VKRVHLLGHPVSQSVSPIMQNAAFASAGLDWEYTALDIAPEDLVQTLERLEGDLDVVGCNVTVPHKIAVFDWLTKNGRSVRDWGLRAGAVNTLFRGAGNRFEGTSTDFQGAMNAIRAAVGTNRPDFPWAFAEVAILGTGGSAQTLAVGFAATQVDAPRSIAIYGRNPEKSQALADFAARQARPGRTVSAHPLADWSEPSDRPRIVCQTTTVGMDSGDARGQSPVPAGTVSGVDIAFDLVYKPHMTPFLAQAAEHGALVVPGMGMLIGQGAQSCQQWIEASDPSVAPHVNVFDHIIAMERALRDKGLL